MAVGKQKQLMSMDFWLTLTEYQVFDLESFRKEIHSANDKEAKLLFQMEKKQFYAHPSATPA